MESRLQVKMNSPDSARDVSIKQKEPEDHPHLSTYFLGLTPKNRIFERSFDGTGFKLEKEIQIIVRVRLSYGASLHSSVIASPPPHTRVNINNKPTTTRASMKPSEWSLMKKRRLSHITVFLGVAPTLVWWRNV